MGLGIGRTAEPITDEQRFAVLDRAHKIGCTFWDTSDFYVRGSGKRTGWRRRLGLLSLPPPPIPFLGGRCGLRPRQWPF